MGRVQASRIQSRIKMNLIQEFDSYESDSDGSDSYESGAGESDSESD